MVFKEPSPLFKKKLSYKSIKWSAKIMKGIETYQENTITTQTQGRIVVMLYEGAIKFLKQAVTSMQAGDHETKSRFLTKAEDIISELNTVLDMESGGEIANNLRALYMFMIRNLHEANIKKDVNKIEEIIKLLEELNQSWKAISN
jgi:flagellar secretion chaperone FliS